MPIFYFFVLTGARALCSSEARHFPTQISFAKYTTPSRAPRPSSTRRSALPPKTMTSITLSRASRPLYRIACIASLTLYSYTSINNTLYELDGLQPAPISHGPCTPQAFPDAIVPVLQRRIQRYPATEIRFNLLACVQDQRIRARDIGDEEALEEQEEKRSAWLWENALRRHNFVGFVGELMKGVVGAKLAQGDGAYDRWIEESKGKTRKRMEDKRKQGIASDGVD